MSILNAPNNKSFFYCVNSGMPKRNTKQAPKGLTKTQSKAVTVLAKKATMRIAETKSFISQSTRSAVSDFYYASNLIYPLSQGTTAETIVGEKIFLKNMHLRVFYKTDAARAASPQTLRIMVVQAKKDLTNTHTSITASDVMRTGGSTPAVDYPDIHKISVLKKYEMVLNPPTTAGMALVKDIYVPINANKTFQVDNGGYFKMGNYYLILHASDFSGINSTGLFSFTWTVNYKDF